MRALIIGKEGSLARRIRELEVAGYAAVEVPGAMHLGRGVWIFPVEVRVRDLADQKTQPAREGQRRRNVKRLTLVLLMLILSAAAVFAECSYCLDPCEDQYAGCYAGCQEYGPPAPSCVTECRQQYNRCFDSWYCGFPGCREFRVQ